jgi:hypothetical protein
VIVMLVEAVVPEVVLHVVGEDRKSAPKSWRCRRWEIVKSGILKIWKTRLKRLLHIQGNN